MKRLALALPMSAELLEREMDLLLADKTRNPHKRGLIRWRAKIENGLAYALDREYQ